MSNSTHIPWLEFFQQDNWYHDLFITYGGLCAEDRQANYTTNPNPKPYLEAVQYGGLALCAQLGHVQTDVHRER